MKAMTKKEKTLLETMPKTDIHNMFGICFDKKDTYTTKLIHEKYLPENITINSVLKKTETNLADYGNVLTVIVFERKIYNEYSEKTNVDTYLFEVTDKKTVGKYTNCYSKQNILEELKKASQIVVIQAKRNSLKMPKYKNYRDEQYYESCNFNNHKILERVKILNPVQINNPVYPCIDVQFLSSGKKLNLSMTWGRKDGETWADVIDKSGYNRKARLIANRFKLKDFKAEKIRKQLKNGDFNKDLQEIENLLYKLKAMIGQAIIQNPISNLFGYIRSNKNYVEYYFDKLAAHNRYFNELKDKINEVGTGKEYIEYTLSIPNKIQSIKNAVQDLINGLKKAGCKYETYK